MTGCTVTALRRFVDRPARGRPVHREDERGAAVPDRAAHDQGFRMAPGTSGSRGRVVSAAIVSSLDARVSVLQDLFAGFEQLSGGGLRGGSYDLKGSDHLVLRRYRYVSTVAVSGTLTLGPSATKGRVRVNGPGRLDGTLVLDGRGGARGTIGGRHVRARRVSAAGASACWRCLLRCFRLLPWRVPLAFLPGISSEIPRLAHSDVEDLPV